MARPSARAWSWRCSPTFRWRGAPRRSSTATPSWGSPPAIMPPSAGRCWSAWPRPSTTCSPASRCPALKQNESDWSPFAWTTTRYSPPQPASRRIWRRAHNRRSASPNTASTTGIGCSRPPSKRPLAWSFWGSAGLTSRRAWPPTARSGRRVFPPTKTMREPRIHPLPPDPAERNGAPVAACRRIGLASNVVTRQQRCGAALVTSAEPVPFREAVAAMSGASVRSEIELGPIRPPQRLAPYSYAVGAEVKRPELDIVPERSDGDAFGRLILLYDPDGADAWDGTMRLVAYIQADLDSSEAVDPLLPEVAWSWLVEALDARAEHVTALGGTVTATTSVRYGDISGPPRAHQLELRASWTALTTDIGTHVEAFCEVLEHAAGLPPVGVTDLGTRSRV